MCGERPALRSVAGAFGLMCVTMTSRTALRRLVNDTAAGGR